MSLLSKPSIECSASKYYCTNTIKQNIKSSNGNSPRLRFFVVSFEGAYTPS